MKKLLTLMIMLGVFLIPRYTTQAALTPPASYDYSYLWNGTTFEFSDGVNTYVPEYTQTANPLGGFDYEYIGDMNGLAPFEITLTFLQSTTSWTLGTIGYIPNESKIGADLTYRVNNRWNININNETANQYILFIDESDTNNGIPTTSAYFSYILNGNKVKTYNTLVSTENRTNTSFLIELYIPMFLEIDVFNTGGNFDRYLSALYFKDLGVAPIIQQNQAYQSGFTDGYGEGYQAGVEEDNAYALGYAKGLSEGADMETGSSIIVLVLAIMAFALMLFGFTSKRRIFNLFASGLFIALGGILFEYPAFIIVTIGLVIVNVYYTFVSD